MSWRHRILWGSVFTFYVWLFLYSIPVTPQICQEPSGGDKQNCAAYRIPAFLFIETTKTVNDYGPAITGLATVFIAMFTIVLSNATRRQVKLTRAAIKMATQEFIATHRPRIFVRHMSARKILPNARINFTFYVFNVGESPAVLDGFNVSTALVPRGQLYHAPYFKKPYRSLSGEEVAGGERHKIVFDDDVILTVQDVVDIGTGDKILHLFGHVRYRDHNGTLRRTGFMRGYDCGRDLFAPTDDPEYEYSD
jgi:hypothetical protein